MEDVFARKEKEFDLKKSLASSPLFTKDNKTEDHILQETEINKNEDSLLQFGSDNDYLEGELIEPKLEAVP